MPVFEKPPLESLTPARDRWTPLYLERGRLEVDDSSVKWIGADQIVLRIPVATVSTILLGPGTTVTHAAVKACSNSNTPICWIGEEGLHYYACGVSMTHDNANARRHAEVHGSTRKRAQVARRMFSRRFPDVDVAEKNLDELRGMEGKRVKDLYAQMGDRFGVTWKGRNYNPSNWQLADNVNRAVSAANAALYALCTAVVCSMGYLPQLGFIHSSGTLPFVYDIADMYKPETTLPAAFHAIGINPDASEKDALTLLKITIEECRLMRRIPEDIQELLAIDE